MIGKLTDNEIIATQLKAELKEKIIEGLGNLNWEENGLTITEDYHELLEGRFLNLDAGRVGDVLSYIQGFHDCFDWLKSHK